jgi:hypothetical protein
MNCRPRARTCLHRNQPTPFSGFRERLDHTAHIGGSEIPPDYHPSRASCAWPATCLFDLDLAPRAWWMGSRDVGLADREWNLYAS